ncbi:LysR family transcriptional regulator [Elioraea sp.]|uniref:LysR family transcriptional regulator n=1 Tax=Elioraea sp. TaxID=2185103 RepID=UPI003F726F92
MHQIRYFLAVCEDLNFTRAAKRCNVSQPALTRAIKLLENEMGGPLFHRERANTHLSELGRMVRPYLTQVYEQAHEARRRALDFTRLNDAVLKLGVMCTVAPTLLLELLRSMRRRHPGVELSIVDASPQALRERLLSGELEIALACQPGQDEDERLHCHLLYRERFVIALAMDHPLARHDAIRVRDLAGQHYLERTHCEFNAIADRIFDEQGVVDRTVYRSERDDWILAMAAAGLGYAFIPEHCARHPDVVARPLVEPEVWRDVCLVTVRGRPHSAAVGALVREAMRPGWRERAVTALRDDRPAGQRAPFTAPAV